MTLKFRHFFFLIVSLALLASPEDEQRDATPPVKTEVPAASSPAAAATNASPVSTTSQTDIGNLFAQDIMLQALELIGVRYRYGGNSPTTGLDCSGFIRYVFQQTLNIALPHNAFAISRLGEDVDKSELKPGDLVFFNTLGRRFSHVGIYLGDERFVHSPSTGRRVEVVNMNEKYWAKRYTGARRVTKETVEERKSRLSQLLKEGNAIERIPKDRNVRQARPRAKPKAKAKASAHARAKQSGKPATRHSVPARRQ